MAYPEKFGAEQIGRRIRQLRIRLSYTQEILAETAQLSVETIQRAERNGRGSRSTIAAIAQALEVSSAVLVGEARASVTAILCEKGGVGRTTLCFNLAALLASRRESVCAVQVDDYGQLFENARARSSAYERIPSCVLPEPELIRDWLRTAEAFSHILIDGTRYRPEISDAVIGQADLIIIPTTNLAADETGIDIVMNQIAKRKWTVPVLFAFNRIDHRSSRCFDDEVRLLEKKYCRTFAHSVLVDRNAFTLSEGNDLRGPLASPVDTPSRKGSRKALNELSILWHRAQEMLDQTAGT